MTDKIKLLTISDHPLIASGVAIQTRYIMEGLLKTGDYVIRSLGGAMSHKDYRPVRLDTYGDDWLIWPVDGYGNPQIMRQALDSDKFDALFFMTDPRFYYFLFEMTDEFQQRGCAVLYNHVWDEYPVPQFNKPFYQACDFIGCISKLTYNIMENLGLGSRAQYIAHAVQADVFKPFNLNATDDKALRVKILGKENADKFVFFYNSRNAVRKRTSDILAAFKGFLDEVGDDKGFLFMHTDPCDNEGANLHAVAHMLGLTQQNIAFSSQGKPAEAIAEYYNACDVLVNISSNEGFGVSCLEALSCGKLAIVNMTGGLQDQIQDEHGTQFGVGIQPASRSLQGSQHIPYIYDCRMNLQHVTDAMVRLYKMPLAERKKLGQAAREWTLRAFSMDRMVTRWDKAIKAQVEKYRNADNQLKVVNL